MVKTLGIGGLFFRAKDPSALAEWYQTYLGIDPAPTSATMEPWTTEAGVTILSPFAHDTDYFPKDHAFMLNFRVENLASALAELNAAGIDSGDIVSMDGVGQFARIHGFVAQIASGDSLYESNVITGGHEQLDSDDLQDHELVRV